MLTQTMKDEDRGCRSSGLMPLMNTAFEPGKCMDVIREMEDGPKKDVALAEYYYFSGHPKQAVKQAEECLTCPDQAVRLSACLIYGYASFTVGEISRARDVFQEMKRMLDADVEKPPQERAVEVFVTTAASVLLHIPLPEEWPSIKDNLRFLPPGSRVFAMYMLAHYYYLNEEYDRSTGIVEAVLAMQDRIYPIPTIYIHLAAVMAYMSLRQPERAKEHLLAAWELARRDDLLEGFGEHHGLLGGMLEAVIKKDWPEDFKRIIAITYQFSAGWRKIHNPATGHDVADNLTTTEFAMAMLAARGWSNKEIAAHMDISVNTVKSCISAVFRKLDVSGRKELKKYMLR